MNLSRRLIPIVLSLVLVFYFTLPLQAAYILTPEVSGGQSTLAVNPGSSFTLDLILTSDAADENTSVVLDVVFSRPGLQLNGFTWGAPYSNNSGFENSDPSNSSLPLIIVADTRRDLGQPVVDIHLENFTTIPFTTGTLVSLDLTVPNNFTENVTIDVLVDTIASDTNFNIASSAGPGFILVVPEPVSAMIIVAGGLMLFSRRRRHL